VRPVMTDFAVLPHNASAENLRPQLATSAIILPASSPRQHARAGVGPCVREFGIRELPIEADLSKTNLNQNANPATKIILQKCAREPEFRRRNY
jgi:hypothetical protein